MFLKYIYGLVTGSTRCTVLFGYDWIGAVVGISISQNTQKHRYADHSWRNTFAGPMYTEPRTSPG